MTTELMEQFYEAYWFIDNHPAFVGGIFRGTRSLDIQVSRCCKNGFTKLDIMHVYRNDERFDEFFGKGLQESFENEGEESEFDHIWVPYKDFYGEEWTFDHVEIWVEGGSHFYVKGGYYGDDWIWQNFHDPDLDIGGRTYEEAIIAFANLVKEKYGDYSSSEYDDNAIHPEWLIENNKKNPPFGEKLEEFFKDGKFNRNPKNVHLKEEEINALWWHFYEEDQDFGEAETLDITKYLTKENYDASEN